MIKKRNIGMQVLLYVVTLGLYGIYWFYQTAKEMIEYKRLGGSAGLWTLLSVIPFINLIAVWKYGGAVESLTEGRYNKILIFVLWFFLPFVVLIITQAELNRLAPGDQAQAAAARR